MKLLEHLLHQLATLHMERTPDTQFIIRVGGVLQSDWSIAMHCFLQKTLQGGRGGGAKLVLRRDQVCLRGGRALVLSPLLIFKGGKGGWGVGCLVSLKETLRSAQVHVHYKDTKIMNPLQFLKSSSVSSHPSVWLPSASNRYYPPSHAIICICAMGLILTCQIGEGPQVTMSVEV